MSDKECLLVYLDTGTYELSWKIKGRKGSRWKGGYKNLEEVVGDVGSELPSPYFIEFTDKRS